MVIPFSVSFDVSESEKVKVVVPLPVGFDVSAILFLEQKQETTIVGLCEVPVLERRLFAYEVH